VSFAFRSSSLLVALVVACGCGPSSAPTGVRSGAGAGANAVAKESLGTGSQATDFTLRDTDGRNVRLSDYLAKDVVLIDFWATWCVPCEAELPHLESLFETYKGKGFVVLGVSMDGPETVAQVGSFARRYNLTFPVLLDEETKVVNVYNPKRTAPLSVLIDRKGQIARVREGFSSGDEKLIQADVSSLVGN
jgi:peroxiredoxin